MSVARTGESEFIRDINHLNDLENAECESVRRHVNKKIEDS